MSRTLFRVNLHSRREIWSLSDSRGIRIHNHIVRKRTLKHSVVEVHLQTKWLWVRVVLLSLKQLHLHLYGCSDSFYLWNIIGWTIFVAPKQVLLFVKLAVRNWVRTDIADYQLVCSSILKFFDEVLENIKTFIMCSMIFFEYVLGLFRCLWLLIYERPKQYSWRALLKFRLGKI